MPCKTRQAALRGERSKPHFFIDPDHGFLLAWATGPSAPAVPMKWIPIYLEVEAVVQSWGASR